MRSRLLMVAAGLLLVAGCGGDSDEATPATVATPATTAAASAPATTATTATEASPAAAGATDVVKRAAESEGYTVTENEIGGRTDLKIQTPEFLATVVPYGTRAAAEAEGKDFERLAGKNPGKVRYAVVVSDTGSHLWWISEPKSVPKATFVKTVRTLENCPERCKVVASD
jgi:hypothetical protein